MAELRIELVQVYEVVEQGYGGGKVVHGVFSTRAEADRRFTELRARQPQLATPGVLWVAGRALEVPREVQASDFGSLAPSEKMRRAGRDYEDKAVTVYTQTQGRERTLR